MEFLTSRHHLFVATIDSIRTLPYVANGPCAEGIGGGRLTELSLRTEEVLFGAGIGRIERIRHDRNLDDLKLVPGLRVLVWSNRTCADSWNVWGWVAVLDSEEQLQTSELLRDHNPAWTRRNGRSPTLSDVRAYVRRVASRLQDAHLRRPDGFDLVVVEGEPQLGAPDTIIVRCRRLRHLAGSESEEPTTLRFAYPSGMLSSRVQNGDSLVVPSDPENRGAVRRFATTTEYFRIDHGFLPALGVELPRLLERFEPRPGGFVLRVRAHKDPR